MFAARLMMSLLLCLAFPLVSWSQPPTFTFETLDLVGMQGRLLAPKSLNDGATLVAVEPAAGGFSYRIDPTLAADPVVCDEAVFPRYPFASQGGPDCAGIDNANTVACNDEHVSGKLYGIVQTDDGTCTPFLYPGSTGTIYSGQTTVPGVALGLFFDPTRPGLLAYQAFSQDVNTLTLLLGPNAQSRIIPTAGNAAGLLVGYGFYDIDADNNYTYQAWLRLADRTLLDLDTPDGDDFCPVSINSDGVILGTAGPCGVGGGVAYWVETATDTWTPLTQFPTTATVALLPTGLNNHSAMTGQYTEVVATGFPPPADTRRVSHTFLATPVVASPTPEPDPAPVPEPRTKHHRHYKPRVHITKHWSGRTHAVHEQGTEERPAHRCWLPAHDAQGHVVLIDGTGRVFGAKKEK